MAERWIRAHGPATGRGRNAYGATPAHLSVRHGETADSTACGRTIYFPVDVTPQRVGDSIWVCQTCARAKIRMKGGT